ncbi:DNA polymerase III subunit beta [Candidatus Woesebacteria bacterium GWB1_43_5]|uniref:Beta sliding clamp n=1 Tax=Candidatus Woesebacteria bacterium GWB1_43_5 TaxID=1802474 RepID=A0A1F7WTI7_9BACT|nr:MAG: DNA polymerase III subunit beta [Candidatus Woesebacteria bacterium GWB1_43_5]
MKLQVLQENLAQALNIASRFASNKAQLPVLANIHLKTFKNKLLINATNLEVSVSVSAGAQIKSEGEITTPARAISEIIGNLAKKPVDLEVDKEQLKITTENFSSTLAGINAGDFPRVPVNVGKNAYQLPTEELIEALNKVLFSVSINESRPAITGVLFIFKPKQLTLVATDGFRLSQKKITIADPKEDFRVIIPKTVLTELTRLSGEAEEILFSYNKDENQVIFGLPGVVVASRVIEGEFPPFEKIIPKESVFSIETDRDELLRAVKLSSVFARDSANVIKFNFKKKGIEISAESKTTGTQKSFVDARINGEITHEQAAFNFRFLEDILGVVESQAIEMSFAGENAPGVFCDSSDKNYLHIIMPVKIQY